MFGAKISKYIKLEDKSIPSDSLQDRVQAQKMTVSLF